jgi:hypothetical protein
MTTNGGTGSIPASSPYIANLWEHPGLTIAIFGLQIHSPEGGALYMQSGIQDQLMESLGQTEGLLGVRYFEEGLNRNLLQYWRTHDDLARYARRMPHMAWWKWLLENAGKGLSFYHEIYQCKTAEAIYETGFVPLGPATFCTNTPVEAGEGLSQERQRRFQEAAAG